MLECPADLRRLSGRKVLFRWDCGWLLGIVKNPIRKGKYNYFVRYLEEDGKYAEYRHALKAVNYYKIEDENDVGLWFLINQDQD